MSYQINKTNGSVLVNLVDGQLDRNSTNLVLVGKNYTGFGEFINENFVKLLENFSNTAAPSNPLEGQLWWDSTEKKIKVYNGLSWKNLGIPYANTSEINKFEGDIWFDRLQKQLFAYDGTEIILIGPAYSRIQGKSGFEVATILDATGANTILKLYIGSALVAVLSNKTFTPIASQVIPELVTSQNTTGEIFKGINVVSSTPGFEFIGTASASKALIDSTGISRSADDFLSSKTNSTTLGTVTIRNGGGLRISTNQASRSTHLIQANSPNRFEIANQNSNQDFSVSVRSSADGNIPSNAIYVKTSTKSVGIFNSNPQFTLDVTGSQNITGNLHVGGNLTVDGETLQVNVSTLNVEGKVLELLSANGEAVGDDSVATGGGIVLKSTSLTADKTFLWNAVESAWESNQHINVASPLMSYKIGGVDKLTMNSLVNITSAPDLQTIGTLQILRVDNITLNGKTISSPDELTIDADENIILKAGTTIDITNSKRITGLGDPLSDQDAANRRYVQNYTSTLPEIFTIDVTGLGTGATLISAVASILTNLLPPASNNIGKVAKLLTVSYTGATVSGVNVEAIKNVTYTTADSNGTQNITVVQDISFSPTGASGSINLVPTRSYMTYVSNGSAWTHQSTTPF